MINSVFWRINSVAAFIAIYLLIIIGIFVKFNFLGSYNFIVQILILASISYFLYEIWKERSAQGHDEHDEVSKAAKGETTEDNKENLKSSFFDIKVSGIKSLFEQHPGYKYFVINQFMLIWDFIFPKNGYIMFKDEKNVVSLIHNNLQPEITIDFDKKPLALLKLIENKNGILVENHIDETLHLIPFYQNTSYKPKSLLGFVLPLESAERMYWIFDSDLAENFNMEDLSIIDRIVKNTSAMTLEALQRLATQVNIYSIEQKFEIAWRLNRAAKRDECLDTFCDFVIEHFQASKLTIAIRKNWFIQADTAVIQKTIGLDDPFKVGFEFPIAEGLNGWVIMKNKPHLIHDIEQGEYFVPRFSKQEKTNYGIRSFLSVPISFDGEAIGMVTLEENQPNKYTTEDKLNLIVFTEILANALNRFNNLETLNK